MESGCVDQTEQRDLVVGIIQVRDPLNDEFI